MTKTELLKAVASATGYAKTDVDLVLKTLEDVVVKAVAEQDDVRLFTGLTVRGVPVEARVCYNPQNGNPVDVPAHTGVKVRITKSFKDRVNTK